MCEMVGNGRKIGEKWDNLRQISQFPHCSTASPPLPQYSSDAFRQPHWPTGEMGTSGLPDIGRFFGHRRWLEHWGPDLDPNLGPLVQGACAPRPRRPASAANGQGGRSRTQRDAPPPPPPPTPPPESATEASSIGVRWGGPARQHRRQGRQSIRRDTGGGGVVKRPPCVTFRRAVVSLRGPGQSPVLPFACCVGSLRSVGRCGRCSCWCHFRVRGAQSLVCWGCAECGGMCRLRVSGAQ